MMSKNQNFAAIGFGLALLAAISDFLPTLIRYIIALVSVIVIYYGAMPSHFHYLFGRIARKIFPGEYTLDIIVRPINFDAPIDFDPMECLPKADPADPFAFEILNTGDHSLKNLKMSITLVDVDIQEIITRSEIFEGVKFNIYKEGRILTKEWKDQKEYRKFSTLNSGDIIIDLIPADSQSAVRFELPQPVRSAISIFMISGSYERSLSLDSTPMLRNLKEWSSKGLNFDILHEIQEEHMYDDWQKIPDLRIYLECKNNYGVVINKTIMIKSIYLLALPPMWWHEENGRTLIAGAGVLSYENSTNPSIGYYNAWKRRKRSDN